MQKHDSRTITVDRHTIELTNEAKIFFPKSGITKGEVIAYYKHIAEHMLPFISNRALSLVRYPNGIQEEGFFQKNIGEYYPSWIKAVEVPKLQDGHNRMVVCNNAATLIYLANQACLTPHCWLSKIDNLDHPDRLVFDLDPGNKKSFDLIRETALAFKETIESLGLTAFAMLTGSRGMHIIIPVTRTITFKELHTAAQIIAQKVLVKNPKHLTMEIRKESRGEKLFIDCNRNSYAQTSVAPYAIRAYEKAPIASPICWKEVEDSTLTPQRYNINNIPQASKEHHPWAKMTHSAKPIAFLLKD